MVGRTRAVYHLEPAVTESQAATLEAAVTDDPVRTDAKRLSAIVQPDDDEASRIRATVGRGISGALHGRPLMSNSFDVE